MNTVRISPSTKIISLGVLLFFLFLNLFPTILMGIFSFDFPEWNIYTGLPYLYFVGAGILIAVGNKLGWVILFGSVFLRFCSSFIAFVSGLFTISQNDSPGLVVAYSLIPVLVYGVMTLTLFLKKIKTEFKVYEKIENFKQRSVMWLHLLNIILIVSIFLNSLATRGGLFLIIDALPHLIVSIIVFIIIKKEFALSWHVLFAVLLERFYTSLVVIISATEHELYFYSFILQLFICIVSFYFLFRKQVLNMFNVLA